jgi:hypothetical protein
MKNETLMNQLARVLFAEVATTMAYLLVKAPHSAASCGCADKGEDSCSAHGGMTRMVRQFEDAGISHVINPKTCVVFFLLNSVQCVDYQFREEIFAAIVREICLLELTGFHGVVLITFPYAPAYNETLDFWNGYSRKNSNGGPAGWFPSNVIPVRTSQKISGGIFDEDAVLHLFQLWRFIGQHPRRIKKLQQACAKEGLIYVLDQNHLPKNGTFAKKPLY